MALVKTNEPYKFDSIHNAMDFVKSLIVEGYSVAINTKYKHFPEEQSIDYFEVYVGEKGNTLKIFAAKDPNEKD